MNIVLAVLSTAILVLLILMWLRANRRRNCHNCLYFAEQYITGLDGQGLYRFGYCQRLIHDCRIVDPDVERECEEYEDIPQEATIPDKQATEGDT